MDVVLGGKLSQGGCLSPLCVNSPKVILFPKRMPAEWAPSAPTQDWDWDMRACERTAGHGRTGLGLPRVMEEQERMISLAGSYAQPPPDFTCICAPGRHLLHLLRGSFHRVCGNKRARRQIPLQVVQDEMSCKG